MLIVRQGPAEIDRLNEAEGSLYNAAKVTALQCRREGYLAALQSPEVTALLKALETIKRRLGTFPGMHSSLPTDIWLAIHDSYNVAEAALAPWKGEA